MDLPTHIALYVFYRHIQLVSYHLLSSAKYIYTSPTTVFQLQQLDVHVSYENLLTKLKISQQKLCSQGQQFHTTTDILTPTDIFTYGNTQHAHQTSKKYLKQSLQNRNRIAGKALTKQQQISPIMMGQNLLVHGLVDGFGNYQKIIKQKYPHGKFIILRYGNQHLYLLKYLTILTSPILLAIFFTKVTIKWSLIMYIWIKSRRGTNKIQETNLKT